MNYTNIITQLSENTLIYKSLLFNCTEKEYLWKSDPEKWCLLEIICHLYDEEKEDFCARTKQVLETPNVPLPPIDPEGWVAQRNYIEQDYSDKLYQFIEARIQSIEWLQSLSNPQWDNAYQHPKFGKMTAKMFLANWLAHDYLHIRQILTVKFDYLKHDTGETLVYAGGW